MSVPYRSEDTTLRTDPWSPQIQWNTERNHVQATGPLAGSKRSLTHKSSNRKNADRNKRQRLSDNSLPEVINLSSSDDESNGSDETHITQTISRTVNHSKNGIKPRKVVDTSDDDILDVYCSGRMVHVNHGASNKDDSLREYNTNEQTADPGEEHGQQLWTIDLGPSRRAAADVPVTHEQVEKSSLCAETQESGVRSRVFVTGPPLCPEQAELVSIIMSGRNVFYTGSAGCGKSTVLKAFTRQLRALGKRVDIIAPTGQAALEVGGSTTWTYAGWKLESMKRDIDKLKKDAHGKHVRRRLKRTHVLVIDEISMVENHFFERLNEIMKEARNCKEAFGGVQLIVTGDFHQLPPVRPFQHCMKCGTNLEVDHREAAYTCKTHGSYYDEDKWAFKSEAWEECDFVYFALKTIHRQEDEMFIQMLQKCRAGDPFTADDVELLTDHPCRIGNATRLYSTLEEVREFNQKQLIRLKTEKHTYKCVDNFSWNHEKHPHLHKKGERCEDGFIKALHGSQFERTLELKKGMLVVLLVNLDLSNRLCNGSQGVICRFEPFDLATIPKAKTSQNREDPENILGEFAHLKESRLREFMKLAGNEGWPVVKFHNGVVQTIFADSMIQCLGDDEPYSLLSRTQIPLAPAWALSIHKSQGLTLDRVIVDFSRAWEAGQIYVALSRARSLEGLKVEGDPKKLMLGGDIDPEVLDFHRLKFKECN